MTTVQLRGTKDKRSATLRPLLLRLLAVGAIALFVLIPMAAGPTLLLGGAITLWAMASFAGEHPGH